MALGAAGGTAFRCRSRRECDGEVGQEQWPGGPTSSRTGILSAVNYVTSFGVPEEHRSEAAELTARLHDAGWSSQVTVERLLQEWEQLAGEVGDYVATIDDYTNDLTARDALDRILLWASDAFKPVLAKRIAAADERFRTATSDDEGLAVGRYFTIERHPGWWWRRRPTTGPLSTYLDGA